MSTPEQRLADLKAQRLRTLERIKQWEWKRIEAHADAAVANSKAARADFELSNERITLANITAAIEREELS